MNFKLENMIRSHIIDLTINNNTGVTLIYSNAWFQTGRVADGNSWPATIAPGAVAKIECYESDWSLLGCSGWVEYTLNGSPLYFYFSNPVAGTNGIDIGAQTSVWDNMTGHYFPISRGVQLANGTWVTANICSSAGTHNQATWSVSVADVNKIYPANLELRNVAQVHANFPATGTRRYYECGDAPTSISENPVCWGASHFKGISSFADKMIFTHTKLLTTDPNGRYLIADKIAVGNQGATTGTFNSLHPGWHHPCSSQACGSFMAMGIQETDDGDNVPAEIQIMDIRMVQVNQPVQLIGKIQIQNDGVNGVAMTKETGPDGKYVIASINGNHLRVFRSATSSLITNGVPTVEFTQMWDDTKFPESGCGLALVTQEGDGAIFLFTLDGDNYSKNQTMNLYKLDPKTTTPSWTRVANKDMEIPGISDSVEILGLHLGLFPAIVLEEVPILNSSFRWGKGLAITSPDTLEVYATDRTDLSLSSTPIIGSPKDFSLVVWAGGHSGGTGFTGPYAADKWQESTSALVSTLWDLSQTPNAITLNTSPAWMVSTDWMTIHAAGTGLITFNWQCTFADGNVHPSWYIVNGVRTLLNTSAASGQASVQVKTGDSFAIMCQSNNAAFCSLTISNFQAPIANECTDFTGPYTAANWHESTSALVGTLWDLSQTPAAIILKTSPAWQVSTDWMTIQAAATGIITFNWQCTSADGNIHPSWYIVNGVRTLLNTSSASGQASVPVNTGDSFAIMCQSNDAAFCTLTISNFRAPM